ncbi:hypothetical protein HMPREF0293_2112 [Corynebacterium glucuronolyticum ATCC 51866]|uniref:Uncharacterized protein n=1 Tax=Corynebacterium glucuronolyticum ATCC 51866 TaxID=548478 RepID=A0ABP2DSH7_9CORY|nr:hypothetical protein HMPREF0293_2112 [Corynebacterium glucuronolyticum ATCC 51866]
MPLVLALRQSGLGYNRVKPVFELTKRNDTPANRENIGVQAKE